MHGRRPKKTPVYRFLQRNKVRAYCHMIILQSWISLRKISIISYNNLHHTEKFDIDACQYWDNFYRMHQDKFFKDRRWLFSEFHELLPFNAKRQATNSYLEDQQETHTQSTGCGANTEPQNWQRYGLTHQHRGTEASRHQESSQVVEGKKEEAAMKTFPGCCASFRILEVFKTLHVLFACFDNCMFTFHSMI